MHAHSWLPLLLAALLTGCATQSPTVTPLGTRFAQQACMPVAQYEDLEQRDANLQKELSRKQTSIDAQP